MNKHRVNDMPVLLLFMTCGCSVGGPIVLLSKACAASFEEDAVCMKHHCAVSECTDGVLHLKSIKPWVFLIGMNTNMSFE